MENVWRVKRNDEGDLQWTGTGKVRSSSPDRGPVQEAMARVFGMPPSRDQL
jgi:hypothetical protein